MQINLAIHRDSTGFNMDEIQLFLVNTFTRKVFHGQAVAVCVLTEELNDEFLRAIAIESHLPETAFIQMVDKTWAIRWFNRDGEVYSSGHGLLAAAYVIFNFLRPKAQELKFSTSLGTTMVSRHQDKIFFDYPLISYSHEDVPAYFMEYVQPKPIQAWQSGPDIVMLFDHPSSVEQAKIDIQALKKTLSGALVLTSASEDADFYVRCFFPCQTYSEETATAAIYPRLALYWADKLQKNNLVVEQGLTRRSEIICEIKGERIQIGGYACCFYQGKLIF
jgi:PhzF family phenazine biosynthesis protein